MADNRRPGKRSTKKSLLGEAKVVLHALEFATRQRNDTAAYAFLCLLDLTPGKDWASAQAPLRGITPIIEFVKTHYGVNYAPNTRETIRDEAVKFFVEYGLLIRNPDNPDRPTNSGNTVYQVEPSALETIRAFGTSAWSKSLSDYQESRSKILDEINRARTIARIPLTLPNGEVVTLSPGGQNPLVKDIITKMGPAFAPGGQVLYIGDTETKFTFLDEAALNKHGVNLEHAAKMPDVIIYDVKRNWLLLIEAVASAGPIDGKRRSELKSLFTDCTAGLVFVTAFSTRKVMQTFASQIGWETEVWIADNPNHMIHFNGERYLGPYDDVLAE